MVGPEQSQSSRKDATAASKTASKLRAARDWVSMKEVFNIGDSDWELTGKELEQLVFPASFRDRPRNAAMLREAVEWKAWLIGDIYLRLTPLGDRLHMHDVDGPIRRELVEL